jgi:hypothetical protein
MKKTCSTSRRNFGISVLGTNFFVDARLGMNKILFPT